MSQEGSAASEAEAGVEQDPKLWDHDEDEAEEMEGFEEAHAPGGPTVEARQARKAAAERTPMTPTAEEDANHRAGGVGERERTTFARAMRNPRDTDLDTLSQPACALIPALASS